MKYEDPIDVVWRALFDYFDKVLGIEDFYMGLVLCQNVTDEQIEIERAMRALHKHWRKTYHE